MKKLLFIGSALGVFALAGAASAAPVEYKATLTGNQVAPTKVTTEATGTATLTLEDPDEDSTQRLHGTLTISGVEPTMVHIHGGACGVDGPDPLSPNFLGDSTTSVEIDIAIDAEDVENLNAGNLYLNVHSEAHPSGEIRGQIFKASDTTSKCPAGDGTGNGDGDGGGGGNRDGGNGTSSGSSGSTSSSGSASPGSTADDSGCSTTGSQAPGGGIALALGVGFAMAAIARARKKTS